MQQSQQHLGYNEIMIVSKYFEGINDFVNLEMGVKRFQGNMERFHFNPIPLNQYSRKLFPNIETFHIYNKNDTKFQDGKIFKQVIWYEVNYQDYLKEKASGNDYKNVFINKDEKGVDLNNVPEPINGIGDNFYASSNMTELQLSPKIKRIGKNCFSHCDQLTKVTVPTSISVLSDSCFYHCGHITEIILSDAIQKLEDFCFAECYSLKSITLPLSIIKVGSRCFERCSSLTNLNIPGYHFTIGNRIYFNNAPLITMVIPSSVKTINELPINKIPEGQKIVIPKSVFSVSKMAFVDVDSKLISSDNTIPYIRKTIMDTIYQDAKERDGTYDKFSRIF
uniref:Leucine rich repeat protein, BspA family n=1 Tax=Entamoeba histolytica TaxID=5759 RepID=A0A060N6K4_ENTHI|nr:leucine rich repeat protein, BspA family [Entamoeba histolytica]